MYVAMFPNLLVSLHPDYVMTHRLTPLAADRTYVECAWLFPEEVAAARGLRPVVRRRLLGHHQPAGLEACESVQRGLSSEHAVPGPLAPEEDGVQQFVARIARGYLGQPEPARKTLSPST